MEPNIHGWRPQPPDSRDFTVATHMPEILPFAAIPSAFDLSVYDKGVDNQGSIGSCTAFGTLGAAELIASKSGIVYPRLDRLTHYYMTRLMQGWQATDSGGYIRDAAKVAAVTGMASGALRVYDVSKFTEAPSQATLLDAQSRLALEYVSVPNDGYTIKAVIAAGYPVIVGFSVPQNFPMGGNFNGIIPMPVGSIIGGHCVRVVGYDDSRGLLKFPNSWSTGWGDKGYGYMPYQFLQQLGADFWVIKRVSGAAPTPPPPPPPPVDQRYITAVKNEFTSPSTGRTIVYFDNNTERTVLF